MSRNGKGAFRKAIAKAAVEAPPKPSRAPRLRRLTDEDIELWLSVAAGVTRRPDALVPSRIAMPVPAALTALSTIVVQPVPLPPPGVKKPALPPLAPLDRKLKQKLSRGRMKADAAIDLHGFRQAEAHDALHRFLHRAQRDGARVVLVVTGKGGRAYDRDDERPMSGEATGVLKRSVPLWLNLPSFRRIVVGYEEAAPPHGGSGALYVRLRRADRVL